MEKQIREKVKVSAVCDQDSLKFERREGKEQHCYTSITKTCQTQRNSLETSTYPSLSLQFKTFDIWDYSEIFKNHSRRISTFLSTHRAFTINTSTAYIFTQFWMLMDIWLKASDCSSKDFLYTLTMLLWAVIDMFQLIICLMGIPC